MKRVGFATRQCSRCGKTLRDEVNFCSWCGQKAVDENDPQLELDEMDFEWRPVFRKRQTHVIMGADDSRHGVTSDEKIERPLNEIQKEVQSLSPGIDTR